MHYLLNLFHFHFTGSNKFMYSRILFNFTCTIYSFTTGHHCCIYNRIENANADRNCIPGGSYFQGDRICCDTGTVALKYIYNYFAIVHLLQISKLVVASCQLGTPVESQTTPDYHIYNW